MPAFLLAFVPAKWKQYLITLAVVVGLFIAGLVSWNIWLASHDAEVRRIAIEQTDTKWERQIVVLKQKNDKVVAARQAEIDQIERNFWKMRDQLEQGKTEYVETVITKYRDGSNPVVYSGRVSDKLRSYNPSKLRGRKSPAKP